MIVPIYTADSHIVARIDLPLNEFHTVCEQTFGGQATLTPISLRAWDVNPHVCGVCVRIYNEQILRLFPGAR